MDCKAAAGLHHIEGVTLNLCYIKSYSHAHDINYHCCTCSLKLMERWTFYILNSCTRFLLQVFTHMRFHLVTCVRDSLTASSWKNSRKLKISFWIEMIIEWKEINYNRKSICWTFKRGNLHSTSVISFFHVFLHVRRSTQWFAIDASLNCEEWSINNFFGYPV